MISKYLYEFYLVRCRHFIVSQGRSKPLFIDVMAWCQYEVILNHRAISNANICTYMIFESRETGPLIFLGEVSLYLSKMGWR